MTRSVNYKLPTQGKPATPLSLRTIFLPTMCTSRWVLQILFLDVVRYVCFAWGNRLIVAYDLGAETVCMGREWGRMGRYAIHHVDLFGPGKRRWRRGIWWTPGILGGSIMLQTNCDGKKNMIWENRFIVKAVLYEIRFNNVRMWFINVLWILSIVKLLEGT